MKRPALKYSATELDWIEARKQTPRRELHGEFQKTFDRFDVSLPNFKALCKRNGWFTGRNGRFVKGQTSITKGMKMPYNPNSAVTRFKKGHQPHNTKYLGHERIGSDGYVWISIEGKNPYTGCDRHYVQKHRRAWEQANGPIPDGHCLKCIDGDKTNCDPANWACIPRALLPRLNGRFGRDFDAAPIELRPMILATAKLEHASRTAKDKNRKGAP